MAWFRNESTKIKRGVLIIPKKVDQKRSRYSDSPVLIIIQDGWHGLSHFTPKYFFFFFFSRFTWKFGKRVHRDGTKKVIDCIVNHEKHTFLARKVSFPMEKERESYLQVATSAPVKLMEEDEGQCKNCTFAVSAYHCCILWVALVPDAIHLSTEPAAAGGGSLWRGPWWAELSEPEFTFSSSSCTTPSRSRRTTFRTNMKSPPWVKSEFRFQ